MTEPVPPSESVTRPPAGRSFRTWIPWAVASGCAALAVVMTVIALSPVRTPSYNEGAHRLAVEKALGQQVSDWPAYLDAARSACRRNDDTLSLFLALVQGADERRYQATITNIRHLCPRRMAVVVAYEQNATG